MNKLLVIGILLGCFTSCRTLKTVTPSPSEILPTIKADDKVTLLLTDGTEVKRLKVVSIDAVGIQGRYTVRVSKNQKRDTISTIDIEEIKLITRHKKLFVLEPGSMTRITLKSGEVIRRLKVTSVDSEKIVGTERIQDANHKFVDSPRTVSTSEVVNIKLRVADPGATAGLITGLVLIGVLIGIAATFRPPGGIY